MLPSPEHVEKFSHFLYKIRTFFVQKGFWEVETPLLNPYTTLEPYIDSFQVISDKNYYLITSPEINLKILISHYKKNMFQISHVFRKEKGKSPHHKNEFLMLEWYHIGFDEFQLMDEIEELLIFLSRDMTDEPIQEFYRYSMSEIFKIYLNKDYYHNTLIEIIKENNLVERKYYDELQNYFYDDLFFLVFLNLIEPKLNTQQPLFIHSFPDELRAYSRCELGKSRRFELYWKNLEIANGYFEIQDKEEQIQVFNIELQKRWKLKKNIPVISKDFLNSFPLPDCSGVSIGLERLFMAFKNLKNIDEISFSEKFN